MTNQLWSLKLSRLATCPSDRWHSGCAGTTQECVQSCSPAVNDRHLGRSTGGSECPPARAMFGGFVLCFDPMSSPNRWSHIEWSGDPVWASGAQQLCGDGTATARRLAATWQQPAVTPHGKGLEPYTSSAARPQVLERYVCPYQLPRDLRVFFHFLK